MIYSECDICNTQICCIVNTTVLICYLGWITIQLTFTYTKSPYPSSTHSFKVGGTNSCEEHSRFPAPDLAKFGYLKYANSTPLKVNRKTICINKIRSLWCKCNKAKKTKEKHLYITVWIHY